MPFTPAHPAIILPLLRSRYFSATGLVIGSIAPDFEYFLKMSVNDAHSHTVAGLVYFDVPISLFLAWLFHVVVKKNFIRNLPQFIQRRTQELSEFHFVRYLKSHGRIFFFSAAVGAASHLLWDGFTHNNTFFTNNSFYRGTFVPFEGVNYPLFYALQHISTVVGMVIIVIYFLMLRPSKVHHTSAPNPLYWITLMTIAAFSVWVRFQIFPADYGEGNLVVSCISGIVLSLICCGLINFRNTTRQQGSLNG